MEAAKKRLAALERALDDLEGIHRVKQHLQRERLTSAALKTAPSDYYTWTLAQRAYGPQYLLCGGATVLCLHVLYCTERCWAVRSRTCARASLWRTSRALTAAWRTHSIVGGALQLLELVERKRTDE
jgi:hypothetical protein